MSAVSLGLQITGPNTLLDLLQPGLRDALYRAVDGQEQLPGVEPATPLLRSAGIESVRLTAKFEGWTMRIDARADEDDQIVFGGCKVDKFAVVPKQGGSIELTFRVGTSDIDESEAGWLFGQLSQELWITLTATPKTAEPIDGTTGHPGAGGQGELLTDGPDDEDEGEDGDGDTPEKALAATEG